MLALAFLPATGGCGASISAVYEGDVRFEHCMALDAQPSVQPRFRRACWVEWVTHYTYGQTRDRVVHAQLRIQQLGGASDFLTPPEEDATLDLHDLGAQGLGAQGLGAQGLGAQGSALTAGGEPDGCEGQCRVVHEGCSRECETPSCQKSCSVSLRRCIRQCG